MRRLIAIAVALVMVGLAAIGARAETFNMADGSTLEGEIVSANEQGFIVRKPDGNYTSRYSWDKLTQDDLKKLSKDPKNGSYAKEFVIEDDLAEKKKPKRPPVPKPRPVEGKLDRPQDSTLIGGLFGSPVGWLLLLALYAANIWAAYEIAVFRAQPVGLVCGLAAVIPILPQIIYLSMPARIPKEEVVHGGEVAEGGAPAEPEVKYGAHLKVAHEAAAAEKAVKSAEPTVFKRGECVFNRRFFETRFTNFFTLVRRDKDKDTVLVIKTAKRAYTANRITRITAGDMHLEVPKGSGTEEVSVSFAEIQEVQLKQSGAR